MDQDRQGQPPMHRVSVLLREVLVLNEIVEYVMRRSMDLNETDFQAMQHLLRHRTMSPGELASALHLTTAATTTVIDRLVSGGHAERNRHSSDRRRWVVSPTAASVRVAMGRLMPMIVKTDDLIRSFSHSDQRAVETYLDGVVASMKDQIFALDPAAGGGRQESAVPHGTGEWL